jgi:hypothetical protein
MAAGDSGRPKARGTWLVRLAVVANSLCLRQEKHMMCEQEVQVAIPTSASMSGKKARMFFVSSCIILAILLLTHVLTYIVGGIIFTVALVAFGVPSNGFRKI